MLKHVGFLYFFVIAFLAGCESDTAAKKTYLDIDSLVSDQVRSLVLAHARIAKKASLDGVHAQSEFTTDSLGWANELDIFRQLDVINKPTNKDSYLVVDGERDVNSNLTLRIYKAKSELPVRLLKLYYYKELQNVKKIEAVFEEKNALYSTQRSLTMTFDEVAGKNLLTGYAIQGTQKMMLSDTVRFAIQSAVIF